MSNIDGTGRPGRAAVVLVIVAVLLAAAAPAVAAAATRQQATRQIAACMKHAGAARVTHRPTSGTAYFARPFNAFNTHYVQWGGYITFNGQVRGTITSSVGLSARQRRAANRCLRPFNGHV